MKIVLKPLRQNQLDCLDPLIAARLAESNLLDRSTVESAKANLIRGYEARYMGAYVDDVENPKYCLIMATFPGMATSDLMAQIVLIYVSPEVRGDVEALNIMVNTAENYARLNGASSLTGSSWLFRGSEDIGSIWKHYGFEIQETTYVKILT